MGRYYEFYNDLAKIRTTGHILIAVEELLKKNDIYGRITAEEAKALIIHLTLSTLGVGEESDIMLCSLKLLAGYSGDTITNRRIKYLRESGYRGKLFDETGSESSRDPEAISKDLTVDENRAYKIIATSYIKDTPDPEEIRELLDEARNLYLRRSPKNPNDYIVRLPRPSYLKNSPRSLPLQNCGFIGRNPTLKKVAKNYRNGQRIQILYGMAGVGKTELALQFAYTYMGKYNAVAWINANCQTNIQKSCRDFLSKLDSKLAEADEEIVKARFLSYFENNADWLIVYDNADYLDNETDNMRAVLESYMPKRHGHILITTRCDANFASAMRIKVDVFEPELALEYLEKNTGQALDEYAEKLAKKLGYLPLALCYAASYIYQLTTYRGYLDRWDRNGMQLFDWDDKSFAEQTVRTAFHITLDKLSDDPVCVDFLQRLACLNVTKLNLEEYVEAMFNSQDAAFHDSDLDKGFVEFPIGNGEVLKYRVVSISANGEVVEVVRISPETGLDMEDGKICTMSKQDRLHSVLFAELARDKLIAKLSRYSLISWDKTYVSMHPLLREIIYTEMPEKRRRAWYSEYETPLMLLRILDDDAAISEVRETAIRDGLKRLDERINGGAVDKAIKSNNDRGIALVSRLSFELLDEVCDLIEDSENEEWAKRAAELRSQLEKKLSQSTKT